jgi:AraC-like DNA-binding protein
MQERPVSLIFEDRPSDSPLVETVIRGRTIGESTVIRPAEMCWHMVFATYEGRTRAIITGPLTTSGEVRFIEGVELLWIRFRLGTYLPGIPMKCLLDVETPLPGASGRNFWLGSAAWQVPDYENADTFIDQLARADALTRDAIVQEALGDAPVYVSERTLRDRFVRATGLTQGTIRQAERAMQAAHLLSQGTPILDTVFATGYYDQPHLTRALKRFAGKTPAQHLPTTCQPE